MCLDPISIIGMGLSIMQGLAGYAQAQAQVDAQNQQAEQNRLNSLQAMRDEQAAVQRKLSQERAATSTEMFKDQIAAARATSQATVAANEAGVTGLSVDALLGDIKSQYGRQNDALDSNFQMTRGSIGDELIQTHNRAKSRIDSVPYAADASPFPFLLGAASGILKDYKDYNVRRLKLQV